jgi:hypothetical protein
MVPFILVFRFSRLVQAYAACHESPFVQKFLLAARAASSRSPTTKRMVQVSSWEAHYSVPLAKPNARTLPGGV